MSEEFAWSYLMWRCHFCQHQKRYSKDGVSHDHVAWKNLTQGAGMPIHQDCHMMWNREKVCWTKVGMPWCDGKPGEHAYIGGGGWSPMQRLRFVFFCILVPYRSFTSHAWLNQDPFNFGNLSLVVTLGFPEVPLAAVAHVCWSNEVRLSVAVWFGLLIYVNYIVRYVTKSIVWDVSFLLAL